MHKHNELLKFTPAERLNYFEKCIIAHSNLMAADLALNQAIREPGAQLIFVFGPTGIGKTTLKLAVEKRIIEENIKRMEHEKGFIPIISIEAVAPDSGSFNWRDFYIRALNAANEPLIDKKISSNLQYTFLNLGDVINNKRKGNAMELRRAYEQVLHNRKPLVVIIDEAQHIGKAASGRILIDQLDTIKSLANMTGVPHILTGTYDLLKFRNLSGQLSRRSIDIHFPRYSSNISADVDVFKSVLHFFQEQIPIERTLNLIDNWEFCYGRSLGCIGILKKWLQRALSLALNTCSKSLTLEHLERTALSISQCDMIAHEIIEGEDTLKGDKDKKENLSLILGSLDRKTVITDDNKNVDVKYGKKNNKVGIRKPMRDKVGTEPTLTL